MEVIVYSVVSDSHTYFLLFLLLLPLFIVSLVRGPRTRATLVIALVSTTRVFIIAVVVIMVAVTATSLGV